MSGFPIANYLRSGRSPLGVDDDLNAVEGGYGSTMLNHGAVAKLLTRPDCGFFNIDTAAKIYWHGRKDYYRLGRDFGPMRPPYPIMWCEWNIPSRVLINDQWATFPEGQSPHMGALVVTEHKNTADYTLDSLKDDVEAYAAKFPEFFKLMPDGTASDRLRNPESLIELHDALSKQAKEFLTVTVVTYMLNIPTGQPIYLPYGRSIGLDLDGVFNDYCLDLTPDKVMPPDATQGVKEMSDVNAVWMALNLINCRNVTTKQSGSVFTRSGREKRQGVPVTRFHTDRAARHANALRRQAGSPPGGTRPGSSPGARSLQDLLARGPTAGQARGHLLVGVAESW